MALFRIAASIVLVHGDQMNSEQDRLLAIDGERQLFFKDMAIKMASNLLQPANLQELVGNIAENPLIENVASIAGVSEHLEAFQELNDIVQELTNDDIQAIKALPGKFQEDIKIFRDFFKKFPCQIIEVLMGALMETLETLYTTYDELKLNKCKKILVSIRKVALSVLSKKNLEIGSIQEVASSLFRMDTFDIGSNWEVALSLYTTFKNEILEDKELLMEMVRLAISKSADLYESFKSNLVNSVPNCPSEETDDEEVKVIVPDVEVAVDVEEPVEEVVVVDQSDKTEHKKGCVDKKTNYLQKSTKN